SSAAILPFRSMPGVLGAIERVRTTAIGEARSKPTKIGAVVNFPANPRPAATVVVLRDSPAGPEVFMVRRHEGTAFMGGAHVFPGGRVDAADHDGSAAWYDGVDEAQDSALRLTATEDTSDAVAYHVAAARELFEEAGVLLARDAAGAFVSLAG